MAIILAKQVLYLLQVSMLMMGQKEGEIFIIIKKGGRTLNTEINKSAVVLGHELYHGWAFEFSDEPKGMNFGQKLVRETGAVKFENYLRASFGETECAPITDLRKEMKKSQVQVSKKLRIIIYQHLTI
ncbi:MAG: hypothetical protein WDO19_21900 [Bacteroidota bacterium]